jgi:hypothetical protein
VAGSISRTPALSLLDNVPSSHFSSSSDDGDVHDFLMISYIVLNIPWMAGSILCTSNPVAKRKRSGALSLALWLLNTHMSIESSLP